MARLFAAFLTVSSLLSATVDARKSPSATRTRTRSHSRSHTATASATATATATSSATASPSSTPPPPPRDPIPGEAWAAFFVINGTGPSCAMDTTDVSFWAARWAPMTGTGNTSVYSLVQPYAWPSLSPIHSKTLSQGSPMAVDAVARRGWALFGTTDWTPHTWVMQLSFPLDDPAAIVVEGVCELLGANYYATRLYYHRSLHPDGPWLINYTYPTTVTTSVTVPPLDTASEGIPACGVANVSVINDAALAWNTLPPPFVGSDATGAPLFVSVATSQVNASQTNLTVWSPAPADAGLVYGPTTWACGYPSYLYACPPTTGADWPQAGLLATYLVNGTLLLGGGPWSSQQYFMTQLPPMGAAAAAGGDAALAAAAGGGGTPVLTFVNVSANAGTWMATFTGSGSGYLPGGPGSWPLSVVNFPTNAGSCVAPGWIGVNEVDILDATGWGVNATTVFNSISPGCPLRTDEMPWLASANCAGASVGVPDLLSGFH